ncbi:MULTISPECIES: DUF7521 family protein [Salinibaculum]|uniref:DUF7521 family protein n=1 Tax=Salinibaculum TaxID=2732368 RepID=UPI0030CAEB26
MSPHAITVPTAIVVMKTLTLILGGIITYLSYRAYSRTRAQSLRYLSIGFAVVTLGTLLAGIIDQLLQMELRVGLLVESVLITAGFAVIVYSLYVTE